MGLVETPQVPKNKVSLKDSIQAAIVAARAESEHLRRNRSLWPEEFASDTWEAAWAFLLNLRTWDEASKKIRPFPDKEYLKKFTQDWIACRKIGRTLYCRKCRRMVISWAARGLELWAMGNERQDQMLGNADYEAAASHCWRLKHLYCDLQERIQRGEIDWPKLPTHVQILYEGDRKLKMFGLANGSRVNIVNARSQTIQGEGTAIATFEEIGLYDNPAAVMDQAKIVCQGEGDSIGGFVVCITNLTLNPKQREIEKPPISDPFFEEEIRGYSTRSLALEGLFVLIEWFADPSRDAAWLARREASMTQSRFRLEILMSLEGIGGTLWTYGLIDQFRLPGIPKIAKIVKTVVAIDPAVTDPEIAKDPHKERDACGMVVASIDEEQQAYVRFDLSDIMSPAETVMLAMRVARAYGAEIVYEENQGKHWIPALFRAMGWEGQIRGVVSTQGKRTRAEPVVIPYEIGHVHHIGTMPLLEAEMTGWDSTNPSAKSPNRLDALVIGITALDLCKLAELRIQENYAADMEEDGWEWEF